MVATDNYRWSKACPNATAVLVAQAGIPVLMEGPPGVAKSSVIGQWTKALDRELVYLIGSTHAPEDFSGIPFLSECKTFFTQTPPRFAERLSRPNALLALDELTTVPPSVRAAMLSMLTERRLGDLMIHASTLILAACNPPEMAPNASPLELSMRNRFFHWDWQFDYEAWADGMMSEDDNFQPRWVPVVPSDWKRFAPEFGALAVSYTRKNSNERINVPKNEEEKAYATPRTWKYLRDALAAAKSVNAPPVIQKQIAMGMVGKQIGMNFMQFIDQRDLVDPEEVLAGNKTFRHDKKRPDLTVTLLTSVVTAIKQQYSETRMDAAIDLFCKNVGKDTADLVLTQLRHLVQARPEGMKLSKVSLAALSEFGDRIPAHLRKKKAAA
jgi:hypothetical protein